MMHDSAANSRFAAAQPHGARLLRDQHQRPRRDRPRRRHRRLPQRSSTCSSTRASGFSSRSTAPGKEGAARPLRSALFAGLRRPLFPRRRRTRARSIAKNAAAACREAWPASGSTSRALDEPTSSPSPICIGQTKVGVDKDGDRSFPPFKGLSGAAAPVDRDRALSSWRDPNGHDVLAAKVVDGKAVRFSFDGLSPFMVFDRDARLPHRRPGCCRCSIASLAILLLTGLLWPVSWLVRRKYGATLALEGRELRAYRCEPDRGLADPRRAVGWMVVIRACSATSATERAASTRSSDCSQIFSIIVFVGGFAVIALVRSGTVWTEQRRWPGKVWSILLLRRLHRCSACGLGLQPIGFGTNY